METICPIKLAALFIDLFPFTSIFFITHDATKWAEKNAQKYFLSLLAKKHHLPFKKVEEEGPIPVWKFRFDRIRFGGLPMQRLKPFGRKGEIEMRNRIFFFKNIIFSWLMCSMIWATNCSFDSDFEVAEHHYGLRALTAEEIVGELTYGATQPIVYSGIESYQNPPEYRAWRIAGKAGNQLEIHVYTSSSANLMAWLVDEQFKNLAFNDDASLENKNPLIQYTLPKTGIYYIVLREHQFLFTDYQIKVRWLNPDCIDKCTLGALRCDGKAVQSCKKEADGCTQWRVSKTCQFGDCFGQGECPACFPLEPQVACGERMCGTVSDGCDKEISCGVCQNNETCTAQGFCIPKPCTGAVQVKTTVSSTHYDGHIHETTKKTFDQIMTIEISSDKSFLSTCDKSKILPGYPCPEFNQLYIKPDGTVRGAHPFPPANGLGGTLTGHVKDGKIDLDIYWDGKTWWTHKIVKGTYDCYLP